MISDYASAADLPPIKTPGGSSHVQRAATGSSAAFSSPSHDSPATWAAKPWMVQNAKDVNVYQSTYFFWVGRFISATSKVAHIQLLTGGLDRFYERIRIPLFARSS